MEADRSERRWIAHVCVDPACDHIEIDGSCNHSQYLCYLHEPPKPLRPVVIGAVELGDHAWARGVREAATNDLWRRPSQHFVTVTDNGREIEVLTDPLPGEDWPGWPEEVHA